ncbi:MAG: flagellar basal-body MS-ring/collar protein FliF [Gammaproteobacteria bacterium]|nr:flagellar basal-body MS-ring/collar protein FliF [Gammaproteobacteria bacterium]
MKMDLTAPMQGFMHLPMVRQVGLLLGLAASVALGVVLVQWSQEPGYRPLYSSLADKDMGQVADALQKSNIPYKMDEKSGAILIPDERVYDTRLKLAAQGLPKGTGGGFEIMEEKVGLGTSQFMEAARYQHALEGELARTIGTLSNVQSSRVHLAIPKQSVFVRSKQEPTASVLVNLYAGRNLEEGQVAAIVHLVASSIPNLSASNVTVIDQKGQLLTAREGSRDMQQSASQLEYAQRLEDSYIRRIEEILVPITGIGRVKAQVVADLDFTQSEQTAEIFNAEKPKLRSEQTSEQQNGSSTGASGVPGALSNQPPAPTQVAEQTPPAPSAADAANANPDSAQPPVSNPVEVAARAGVNGNTNANQTSNATRNYEIDKTISHTRNAAGAVRRLSVAVVVDDRQGTDDEGEVTRTPLKPEELVRITTLVKEAVGFNEKRGDTVNVINASFSVPEAAEPLPEPSFFSKPWVAAAGKQLGAGLVVLLLVLGVLRPVLSGLASRAVSGGHSGGMQEQALLSDDRVSIGALRQGNRLAAPGNDYDTNLSTTKALAAQDPKRVAQVVKNWVATDA